MRANPFVEEGIRARFADQVAFRSYVVYLSILALTLFLWWPRDSVDVMLRTHSSPGAFSAVGISLFVCLAYLQTRYGLDGFATQPGTGLREYVSLTPLRLGSILAGKLGFAVAHTAFLLLLGAPFLVAAVGVSGVVRGAVLLALLVIGLAVLAWRLFAILLLVLLEQRPLARDLLLLAIGGVFLILTFILAPSVNPIVLILALNNPAARTPISVAGISLPFFGVSVIIDLAAALACGAGLLLILSVVRRSARNRGSLST